MSLTGTPDRDDALEQGREESSNGRVERFAAWIDSLPDAVRPPVYGALFILLFAMHRGALVIVPLAIIYVFVTSKTPLLTLGRGVGVLALAMLGGALSGLAYSLLGRRVQRAFKGGWYLTGLITISPYIFVLVYVIRLADGKPFWAPLETQDYVIGLIMTLLFGLVIGGSWFSPDDGKTFLGEKD